MTVPSSPPGWLRFRRSLTAGLTLLYREIARQRGAEIIRKVGPSSSPALAMTGDNLRRLVPDVAGRDVYLCASPGLSEAVRTALRDAGHPGRRLHEGVFGF